MNRQSRYAPVVCIAAPILCYVISTAVSRYTTYRMGYELLMLNGLLTYCGLYGTSYDNENENENENEKR